MTGPPPADIPDDQQRIRARCVHPAGTFVGFGADELEQSIPARFERQVLRYPERPAVKTRSHRLSYAELNRAANRVARAILTRRGEGNEPVAVLLDQGAAAAAAMLGVLKAGKIYVPLDPAFPAARLAYMLGDSGAELVLTSADHLTLAEASGARGGRALDVDALIDWRGEPKASRAKHGNAVETSAARSRPTLDEDHAVGDLGAPISPDALAYIVYTSGSTGQPKGVVQNHRNVLHKVMTPTNDFHICPDDRLALLYGGAVAIGVRISLCAWLNGAALYPIALKSAGVAGLAAWLVEEGITVYHSVATVFRHFVDALTGAEEFPDLRLIFVTGEAVYPREIQAYQARFAPDCVFVHGFGLAELSHVRQYYVDRSTPVQGGIVPVGYAVDGVEVRLLNEAGMDTRPGQIGEIVLESPFVTVGYWRKPELDRAAFLPDPTAGGARIYRTGDLGRMRPDGCLEHLGRTDFQMEVRVTRSRPRRSRAPCSSVRRSRKPRWSRGPTGGASRNSSRISSPPAGPRPAWAPSAGRWRRHFPTTCCRPSSSSSMRCRSPRPARWIGARFPRSTRARGCSRRDRRSWRPALRWNARWSRSGRTSCVWTGWESTRGSWTWAGTRCSPRRSPLGFTTRSG